MAKSTREETIARFFKKVRKTDTCWIWVGALNDKGYGNFYAQMIAFVEQMGYF